MVLLHLNRSTYHEAIFVLYGHISFQFVGSEGWCEFYIFQKWFLTEASPQHLRSLEFDFLPVKPDKIGRGFGDVGFKTLKSLQRLNTLTFRVLDGITRKGSKVFRAIRDKCPHGCQISLTIPNVMDGREVRISPGS